jgi:hypothetical protein
MKRLLQKTALIAVATFASPAIAGEGLKHRLETLRQELGTLNDPTSVVGVIQADMLDLKALRYGDETAALPAQRAMQRGQIGLVPASLVLVHLNSIHRVSADATFDIASMSKALVIRAGRLTLKQLLEDATRQFPEVLLNGPNGPIAQVPIFIWSDAELVLEKGDYLSLSAQSNSFILNAGVLRMQHAKLSVDGSIAAVFRPFVVTILGGALQAQGSVFADLGFPGAAGSEGVTISNSPLSIPQGQTVLSGNAFERIGSLCCFA